MPDTALMERALLFTLFLFVVAGLQESLDVVLVPEQTFVPTMRDLVICHELRSISFKLAAAALALKSVTQEDPYS